LVSFPPLVQSSLLTTCDLPLHLRRVPVLPRCTDKLLQSFPVPISFVGSPGSAHTMIVAFGLGLPETSLLFVKQGVLVPSFTTWSLDIAPFESLKRVPLARGGNFAVFSKTSLRGVSPPTTILKSALVRSPADLPFANCKVGRVIGVSRGFLLRGTPWHGLGSSPFLPFVPCPHGLMGKCLKYVRLDHPVDRSG